MSKRQQQQLSVAASPGDECEGGAWARPSVNLNAQIDVADASAPLLEGGSGGDAAKNEKVDKRGLILSFLILVFSIPALIGAWCWPAIVIALISGGTAEATSAERATGHIVAVALTGAMMIVFVTYTAWTTHKRRRHIASFWRRCGPLLCAIYAALLIMLEPVRHLVMDNTGGIIGGTNFRWLLAEYRPDCGDENFKCFATGGWIFTFACTWIGFALLTVSTLWLIDARSKVRQFAAKWRQIRAGR